MHNIDVILQHRHESLCICTVQISAGMFAGYMATITLKCLPFASYRRARKMSSRDNILLDHPPPHRQRQPINTGAPTRMHLSFPATWRFQKKWNEILRVYWASVAVHIPWYWWQVYVKFSSVILCIYRNIIST